MSGNYCGHSWCLKCKKHTKAKIISERHMNEKEVSFLIFLFLLDLNRVYLR